MKTIAVSTKITFTATGEKYSIIEKTETGFVFKPIKFEKNLSPVPRTFEEVKTEFADGEIDIEGFEHNDADGTLVSLIMDGFAKDAIISNAIAQKDAFEKSLSEQKVAMDAQEQKIIAHEATISEQQTMIQHQKDEMHGYKDEIKKLNKEKSEWKAAEEEYKMTIAGLESSISE